ncbi:MAG TPA: hypothetical protein VMC41_03830 [Candidatus Nanoarchaeia archaeon]|nr:hypothetical protein [Candidatus Nanoarchaeia archaeon]
MNCEKHEHCATCLRMHDVVFTEEIKAGEETLYAETQKFKEAKTFHEKHLIAKRIENFVMKNLIQGIEQATGFNFNQTARAHQGEAVSLSLAGIHYCQETPAAKNFREKRWPVIWNQINSPINKWDSGFDFNCKPDFFQRYCHYLRSSGLIHYWEECEKEAKRKSA